MWHLLKAEISYNQRLLLGILGLMLPLSAFGIMRTDIPGFMFLIIMFMLMQSWVVNRNREKREFQFAQLPLPPWQTAAVRIFILIALGMGIIAVYGILFIIVSPTPEPYHANPAAYLGLIIFGFSIYFALRDLLIDFFRRAGFTRERTRVVYRILFAGLMLFGVFASQLIQDGKPLPLSPEAVADFIVGRSSVHSGVGLVKFLVLSGCFALLTLFTCRWRKSFLE